MTFSIAALLGLPLTGEYQLSIAAALMLLGGLPHGAFDIALAQEALRLKWQAAALLLLAYVSVAAFMMLLWSLSPVSALIVFLIFSAVHFGDDWRMIESGLLRSMAGAAVLCVAAFFKPVEVSNLFILLAGENAQWAQRILVAFTPVALLVTLVGMYQAAAGGSREWALAQTAALAGLACLPPQLGFLLFFVFLHSPLHMRGIATKLPGWSVTKLWFYGSGICILCFVGVFLFAPNFFAGRATEMSAESFRILSVVAAPHLLLGNFVAWVSKSQATGHAN